MSAFSPRIYRFQPWLVRALIPRGYKGSYILYNHHNGVSEPVYVGRSDHDLQRRLAKHPLLGVATHFEYDIHGTADDAFVVECSLFHILEETLMNKVHPARPSHSTLKCPFCSSKMVLQNRLQVAGD